MEKNIVISKLFILIYCIICFVREGTGNEIPFVLIILAYIIVNMLYYIFEDSKIKNLLAFLSAALIIYGYIFINPVCILMLPFTICELVYRNTSSLILTVSIMVVTVFIMKEDIKPIYILLCMFSCLIYIEAIRIKSRLKKLDCDNDELREKNFNLRSSLEKNAEYENQIKYLSQLEERNKIAQEIHDNIGHTIVGGTMQLEAARIVLKSDKSKADIMIQNTIAVLRNGMDELRTTLKNIKPQGEQLGISRVKLLVDEFRIKSGMQVNFMYEANIEKITYMIWNTVYQNINECLTNIMKYSQADKVNIKIDVLNKLIKVEVKDNGIGAYSIKKGIGLTGIEERTEEAKGKVIIDGSYGFSVITLFPIGGDEDAD